MLKSLCFFPGNPLHLPLHFTIGHRHASIDLAWSSTTTGTAAAAVGLVAMALVRRDAAQARLPTVGSTGRGAG